MAKMSHSWAFKKKRGVGGEIGSYLIPCSEREKFREFSLC